MVLVVILLIIRFLKGFVANIAGAAGLVIGMLVCHRAGQVSFANIGQRPLVRHGPPVPVRHAHLPPRRRAHHVPRDGRGDDRVPGHVPGALARSPASRSSQKQLSAACAPTALGTLIGGIFNTFPYTSFSQNVGLVGVTGVRSRFVCVTGGVILLALGLVPKLACVVASVPQFVLGGAGIVMFGMVAATGIRILGGVDFQTNRNNLYIVAISIGFGMIPLVADQFFSQMPKVARARCWAPASSWPPSWR